MRADARQNFNDLLAAAQEVVGEQGADASLRDIARRAGVGPGTLHRHFPTRGALLEALLRSRFDGLAARAGELEASAPAAQALLSWLGEAVAVAHDYRGVVSAMAAAIDDPGSALHASCVAMKEAGGRLLRLAQANGAARTDIDDTDLFGIVGALAWLGDQPSLQPRADHLFGVITGAILAQ